MKKYLLVTDSYTSSIHTYIHTCIQVIEMCITLQKRVEV